MYAPALSIPVRTDFTNVRVQTVYANNITFLRWIISNGDDSISMKQNSTNIYIANCTFYKGLSFAMGSIGQYPGQINVIENVTAENIILHDTIWEAESRLCVRLGLRSRSLTKLCYSGLELTPATRQMVEVRVCITCKKSRSR